MNDIVEEKYEFFKDDVEVEVIVTNIKLNVCKLNVNKNNH